MKWLLLAAAVSFAGDALSQGSSMSRELQLREPADFRSIWPYLRKPFAWTSGIPMHLRYEEMSPQQQALVKRQYENLGPNDEPPFPTDGLAPLVDAIHKAQGKLLVEGNLDLIADIDPKGLPRSVSAYSSPSETMTRFAAEVLMLTRFKPARCAGEPCAQRFPLRVQFKVE